MSSISCGWFGLCPELQLPDPAQAEAGSQALRLGVCRGSQGLLPTTPLLHLQEARSEEEDLELAL